MNLLYIKSPSCFRSYFLCFLLFLTYSPVSLSDECSDAFKNPDVNSLNRQFSDLRPNNAQMRYLGNSRIVERTRILKEIVKKGNLTEVVPWLREVITDRREVIKIRKTAVDEYVSALNNYGDAFDHRATSELGNPKYIFAKLSTSVSALINEKRDRGLPILKYIGEALARLRHTDADINSLKGLIEQFEQSKYNADATNINSLQELAVEQFEQSKYNKVQEHRKKENPNADSIPKSGAQKWNRFKERSKLLTQIVQNTEHEAYFPYFMKVTLDETEFVITRLFVLQKLFKMPDTPLLKKIEEIFRRTLEQRIEVLISNTGVEVLPKDNPNQILLDFINSHTNNVTRKQQLPPR